MAYDQWTFKPVKEPKNTRCKTKLEYCELYSGPPYYIHLSYAELIDICAQCFLFGPGIPIVFPIGLINLIIIYVIDKIALARLYTKPPRYSVDLTLTCIAFLTATPLLYCMFGFWMFSNK